MPAAPVTPVPVWDIFCRVVDNFGDIGTCWRLGRQLAAEHGLAVRLWVDAPEALAKLRGQDRPLPWEPHGLVVLPWEQASREASPGAVVIEAFACQPPQEFIERMAHQNKALLWINLEYLSAEDWVEGCHGLQSPQPGGLLSKVFVFPGFTGKTGGLIREAGLLAQRDAFQADAEARQGWWQGLGGSGGWEERFNASLFAYEVEGLAPLLAALAQGAGPARLLVPEGPTLPALRDWFGRPEARAGEVLRTGALEVWLLPFVPQPDYDRLLWACDLNVVRGEDSFLRAQWAGRPFIWHIYSQAGEAHLPKLEVFLGRYLAGAPTQLAQAVRELTAAWNGGQALDLPWSAVRPHLEAWTAHARGWAAQLARQKDLARYLVDLANSRL